VVRRVPEHHPAKRGLRSRSDQRSGDAAAVVRVAGTPIGWTPALRKLYHFRTAMGREVDLVLEDEAGRLVGVEVKASTSVCADDFRGLQTLRSPDYGCRGTRTIAPNPSN